MSRKHFKPGWILRAIFCGESLSFKVGLRVFGWCDFSHAKISGQLPGYLEETPRNPALQKSTRDITYVTKVNNIKFNIRPSLVIIYKYQEKYFFYNDFFVKSTYCSMYVFHYITSGYTPRLNIATRFLIKLEELLNCNNEKMNQVQNQFNLIFHHTDFSVIAKFET